MQIHPNTSEDSPVSKLTAILVEISQEAGLKYQKNGNSKASSSGINQDWFDEVCETEKKNLASL